MPQNFNNFTTGGRSHTVRVGNKGEAELCRSGAGSPVRLQPSDDAAGLKDWLPRSLTQLLARGLGDSAGPLLVPW